MHLHYIPKKKLHTLFFCLAVYIAIRRGWSTLKGVHALALQVNKFQGGSSQAGGSLEVEHQFGMARSVSGSGDLLALWR